MSGLAAPLTALALAAALQVATPPDESPPTPLEAALIDHTCVATQLDVAQTCRSNQLLTLRTNFGRDLRRLSAAERKTVDSACSTLNETRGRDAYVACLSTQLTELIRRRSRATPTPPAGATAPAPTVPAPGASPEPPPPQASSSTFVWIGAGVVAALAAAAGAFLVLKGRRRTPVNCRSCGARVEGPGDLCQKCRREAADALRHAAAERAGQERAQNDQQRRLREQEEEQQRQKVRQAEEEEARRRQQEEARQREEAARREKEEARRQREAAAASDDAFDPHAVLGVPRDASQEAIQAAYEAARAKYGPDQVEFLSTELQAHYKAKGEAVERAYQQLTAKS